jgi:hypothetical protein
MPDIQPQFTTGANGAFVMEIPAVNIALTTSCTPASPSHFTYKPRDVVPVVMPELARVVFYPGNTPGNRQMSCCATKCGDVMEFDPSRSIEAKLKTNSPYGKACLGSIVFNWRLHLEGHVAVKRGIGHAGASRLVVELRFTFDCNISSSGEGVYAEVPASAAAWPSPQLPIASSLEWSVKRPLITPQSIHWTAISGGPVQDSLEAFVEVMPKIEPLFEQGPKGTFVMLVPDLSVRFTTTCSPAPSLIAGVPAFKPFEEIPISMPEICHVVFDPLPRDGRLKCVAKTCGTIMQFLPTCSIDAKMKTNSPHGTINIRNAQDGKDALLNWNLHVEGKLEVLRGAGISGSNKLTGELYLTFECSFCV